jgi:hypothetical protein
MLPEKMPKQLIPGAGQGIAPVSRKNNCRIFSHGFLIYGHRSPSIQLVPSSCRFQPRSDAGLLQVQNNPHLLSVQGLLG